MVEGIGGGSGAEYGNGGVSIVVEGSCTVERAPGVVESALAVGGGVTESVVAKAGTGVCIVIGADDAHAVVSRMAAQVRITVNPVVQNRFVFFIDGLLLARAIELANWVVVVPMPDRPGTLR